MDPKILKFNKKSIKCCHFFFFYRIVVTVVVGRNQLSTRDHRDFKQIHSNENDKKKPKKKVFFLFFLSFFLSFNDEQRRGACTQR